MVDKEKQTKRKKILDRLNSNDTGPHYGQRHNEERLAKEETERQKALEKGRRGLGWIGSTGGI